MSPEATKERILDGFAEQLLDVGYRGISLQAITDAVGIKRPSMYHHFPEGKEQIYVEVALRMIEADGSQVNAALAGNEALRDKLVALALLHSEDPRKTALDQRIFDATRYVSDDTRTLVSTRYVAGLLTPVRNLMAEAVAAGELRDEDPGLLMEAFFGITNAVPALPEDVGMPPAKRGGPRPAAIELANRVVTLFLEGAAAR
ncbi:MAG: TetR/AcrR family transcriptional regulator [Acidimicrobiia bacterium]|nr:TetR/AcrR family transcriptional regulator [Acidimicrobiia bacterium]